MKWSDLLLAIALSGSCMADRPSPPSNLVVRPLGSNSFLLEWKDNSNNETGWDIRISTGVTKSPGHYMYLPIPEATSHVALISDLPGKVLSFQIAAYNGKTGLERISQPSSVVIAKALEPSSFEDPGNLVARALDDGRIRLSWEDHSNSEHGYRIEFKKDDGKWREFGITNPGKNFHLLASGFRPGSNYLFRVCAFKQHPDVQTGYSNSATATTESFLAPSSLNARAEGEGAISLRWKDNSSIEDGYEIERRAAGGKFTSVGEVGPGVRSTYPISGALDTDYEFRVRAYRNVKSKRVRTAYARSAVVRSNGLAIPSEVASVPVSDTSARVIWKDNSAREYGYQVFYRKAGSQSGTSLNYAADTEGAEISGLAAGQSYEVQVRAYDWFSYSDYSEAVPMNAGAEGFTGNLNPPVFWNTSFVHEIGITDPSRLKSLAVSGLPEGLGFDPVTRTISGIPTEEGVKVVQLLASFDEGYEVGRKLVMRITRPPAAPVATGEINPVFLGMGERFGLDLMEQFSDPDTPDACRLKTSLGNIDVILYSKAAPDSVANFLKYVDSGRYNGSFFHRSPPDFVLQGGGYATTGAAISKVAAYASLKNEPGISNAAGTIAMAKIAGNPDSATSEFFFNLENNAANLDFQNGGFSVFGRVSDPGMVVLDRVNDLPRGDYPVTVAGKAVSLTDLPVNGLAAPAVFAIEKLVRVESAERVGSLVFDVSSLDASVATATVDGSQLVVTAVAPGSTIINVTAKDLDGESVARAITVQIR